MAAQELTINNVSCSVVWRSQAARQAPKCPRLQALYLRVCVRVCVCSCACVSLGRSTASSETGPQQSETERRTAHLHQRYRCWHEKHRLSGHEKHGLSRACQARAKQRVCQAPSCVVTRTASALQQRRLLILRQRRKCSHVCQGCQGPPAVRAAETRCQWVLGTTACM